MKLFVCTHLQTDIYEIQFCKLTAPDLKIPDYQIFLNLHRISNVNNVKSFRMNNFWRTIIAAYGAKKLGGGCISTIVIFIVIFMLLKQCG
jgi:hypothetical protein